MDDSGRGNEVQERADLEREMQQWFRRHGGENLDEMPEHLANLVSKIFTGNIRLSSTAFKPKKRGLNVSVNDCKSRTDAARLRTSS